MSEAKDDPKDTPEDHAPEPSAPHGASDTEGGAEEATDPDLLARRQLLGKVCVALGAAGGVAMAVPTVGFVVAPLFRSTPQSWRSVGKLESFNVGETVAVTFADASPLPWAGVTGSTAAWLRRVSATDFIAFSINCAHLGCPVRWLPDARLFMCPCHGGVYNADGSVAAGPPPHGLSRYPVRVEGGDVQILTGPIPIG